MREELDRLNKKVNANYKKAMTLVGKKSGKQGQNAFRKAQQAWLKWREQDSNFYGQFDWGLVGDRINMSHTLDKTAERVRSLEDLIKELQDD